MQPIFYQTNGVFTLPDTDRDQDRYNPYSAQWESVMMSFSVQYEHPHTILYSPFFIGLGVCVGQCERTIVVVCSPHVIDNLLHLSHSYNELSFRDNLSYSQVVSVLLCDIRRIVKEITSQSKAIKGILDHVKRSRNSNAFTYIFSST